MHKLTDGFIGVVLRQDYRLEIWEMSTPNQKRVLPRENYLYITKIHFDGEIGNRSIGLPVSDLSELIEILRKINETSHNLIQ